MTETFIPEPRKFRGDGPLAQAEQAAEWQARQQHTYDAAAAAKIPPHNPDHVTALVAAYRADIERALEAFHEALDDVTARNAAEAPELFLSTEWVDAIEAVTGDVLDSYRDHIQETWEPYEELA